MSFQKFLSTLYDIDDWDAVDVDAAAADDDG